MLASVEKQMTGLLPRLAKRTDTTELEEALNAQLAGCKTEAEMLGLLLEQISLDGDTLVCLGMDALLGECSDLLDEYRSGNLRDAVMIAHMQRAEHYKLAAYGSAHDFTKLLGYKEAAEPLDQAARATVAVSMQLGRIAIQVNAEAYVDNREESLDHSH